MRYVHHCHFCGAWRPAATATVLEPRCGTCGCTLASSTREEWDARFESDPELEPFFVVPVLTPAGAALLRTAGVAATMLVLALLAAPYGAPAAAVAVGLAGLVLLPLLAPVERPPGAKR